MAVIGGINLVKIAVSQGLNDLSVFHKIGSCDLEDIKRVEDFDKLLNYYLVWYKPNDSGQNGWQVLGSINYMVKECIDEIIKFNKTPQHGIDKLIDSLSLGANTNIDIMVAHDLILDKAIIIDGTKRALALLFLKYTKPYSLEAIFKSGYSITVTTLRSRYSKAMFPCDFLKLC
jgi:hypothetical protein